MVDTTNNPPTPTPPSPSPSPPPPPPPTVVATVTATIHVCRIKFVQWNLAVVEGRVIIPVVNNNLLKLKCNQKTKHDNDDDDDDDDDNDDDDNDDDRAVNGNHPNSSLLEAAGAEAEGNGLFVHCEPVHVFVRSCKDVYKLKQYLSNYYYYYYYSRSKNDNEELLASTATGPTTTTTTTTTTTNTNANTNTNTTTTNSNHKSDTQKHYTTGRWHVLMDPIFKTKIENTTTTTTITTTNNNNNQNYSTMVFQLVPTKAIERNRRGNKLLECHDIVKLLLPTTTDQTKNDDDNNDDDNDNDEPFSPSSSALLLQNVTTKTRNNDATTTTTGWVMHDKTQRHVLFAEWLIHTYGKDALCRGSGVLDVAGGKGQLSMILQARGIPSVVMDPNPRLSSVPTTTTTTTTTTTATSAFSCSTTTSRSRSIPVIAVALEGDGSYLFGNACDINKNNTEEDDRISHKNAAPPPAAAAAAAATTTTTTTTSIAISQEQQELVHNCSMIVGMHPDQATEPIIRLAQRLQVPFALLPCCVMPTLFPNRIYKGQPVRSYRVFCQYLQSLYNDHHNDDMSDGGDGRPTICSDYLPFMGRNMILYTTRLSKTKNNNNNK